MKLLIIHILEDFQGLIYMNFWNGDKKNLFSSFQKLDFFFLLFYFLHSSTLCRLLYVCIAKTHLRINISAWWLICPCLLPQKYFCLIIIGVWEKDFIIALLHWNCLPGTKEKAITWAVQRSSIVVASHKSVLFSLLSVSTSFKSQWS